MADQADGRRDKTQRDGSGLSGDILMLRAVVVLEAIMTVLDLTIANVAIPTLGRDFGTWISTIQWVMTGRAGELPLELLDQGARRHRGTGIVRGTQRLLPEAKPQLGGRLDLRGLMWLSPGIAVSRFLLWGASGPLVSVAGSRRGPGTARCRPRGNSSTSETNSTPRAFSSSTVFRISSVSIVIDAGGLPIAGSACPGVPGQRTSWKSSPLTPTVRNRGPSGVGFSTRFSRPRTFV